MTEGFGSGTVPSAGETARICFENSTYNVFSSAPPTLTAKLSQMSWIPKLLRRIAFFLTLWALLPLGSVFLPNFTTPFSPIASFQIVMVAGLCYLASSALESRPKLALHLPKLILGAAILNLGYLIVSNYVAVLNAIMNNAPLPDFPTSTAFTMGSLALLFGLVSSALNPKRYKRAHPPFEG